MIYQDLIEGIKLIKKKLKYLKAIYCLALEYVA